MQPGRYNKKIPAAAAVRRVGMGGNGKVTREQLESYRSMKDEAKELGCRRDGGGGCARRIRCLEESCAEIEAAVEGIPDSLTRRVFRMYFLDGMSQEQVARKVHLSQSSVSKKISRYLQME